MFTHIRRSDVAFVADWLNSKNEGPIDRHGYISSSEFDPTSFSSDISIILTNDKNLAVTAPADNSNLSRFPVVVYVDKLDSVICDKLLELRGRRIYWLEVGRANERPIDCYKRAYKEMLEAYSAIPLRCIIALKTRDSKRKVYSISSTDELATIIKFTQIELDFLYYEKDVLVPNAMPTNSTSGEIWQLNMPGNKNHGAYFPLLLFRHFRFEITSFLVHSVYEHFTIAHFYQPQFGTDDLAQMIKVIQDADFGYDPKSRINNGVVELQMQLNGITGPQDNSAPKAQHQVTYFGYQFDSKISREEQNTLDLMNARISALRPSLIILDIKADLLNNSCLQQILLDAQNAGSMIWFCCHDKLSAFPLITTKNINVSANVSIEGDVFFKAQIHSLPNGFFWPSQIAFGLIKQPMIPRSKYVQHIGLIRYQASLGASEKTIAESLQISIYTLRQLKRQFKIRKNLPLKVKRRQGLDAKILRLYSKLESSFLYGQNTHITPEQEKSPIKKLLSRFPKSPYVPPMQCQIKEIAAKLKLAPSYVKKRLYILQERLCKEYLNSNSEPEKP